jgi:hypothetical protein
MTPNDKTSFVQLLIRTAEGYGKKLSELAIDEYWLTLAHYDFHLVATTIKRLKHTAANSNFMPTTADIVQAMTGNTEIRALRAWNKTLTAMSTPGCYESVVFDDPVIHAVIHDLGGWVKWCLINEKQLQFEKHTFLKLYSGYLQQGLLNYPNKLIGLYEQHNSARGYVVKSPYLIGDETLALRVYKSGNDQPRLPIRRLTLQMDDIKKLQPIQTRE